MKPEEWQEVERLYQACVELTPRHRSGFLAESCSNGAIRREVESLLVHREHGPSFLERDGIAMAAEMITRGPAERLVGRTLGHYHIDALVGSGGMGLVYRGRDTRLGREVALKVLPEEFSQDRDRLIRFEREATLLAALNHPNIAAIHDFEESEGIRYLVLEFVEGETLSARLKRGRVSVSETLNICGQIADALEAAHERAIVHRDLKPGNVMITPNGVVKVLDFGIAKMLAKDAPGVSGGVDTVVGGGVLGTPSYMSPEQARGTPTDKRSDIWAFGCVLYEMLTGHRAFEAPTVTDTLAAIVQREPDWSALPKETPPTVRALLRRCLHKDPRWRLRDAGDARIQIAEAQREPPHDSTAKRSERGTWTLRISTIGLAVLTGALLARWAWRPASAPAPEMRVEITTPPTTDPVSFAISPDGSTMVFVASDAGRSRLWLRSLSSTSARAVEKTDGASCPFWSADGLSVGFFADNRIKRVDVDSGAVQDIVGTPATCGATWNRDHTILFSPAMFGPISRVSSRGGASTDVTRVDAPRQGRHRSPMFFPDGRHFLYYVEGVPEARGVYVSSLDGSDDRRLLDADTAAVYVSSGHLLFVRQRTLFAQAFDPARLVLSGSPFPVEEQIVFNRTVAAAAVSASSTGVVVYRRGVPVGRRQFVWLDRSGHEIDRVGEADSENPLDPALSPDQRHVALYRTVHGVPDVWLLDTSRGVFSRFTFGRGLGGHVRPVWSPDGNHLVFCGIPKGVTDLFRKPIAGGSEDVIFESNQPKAATDWSRDGRFLLYRSSDPNTGWDLWALPMNGTPDPIQVVRTNFDDRDGQFSPDAKWVAYQSNESGRYEIYAQRFPGPAAKIPLSTNGGAQVRWRRDGKELFYVAPDDRLMAVKTEFSPDGSSIEVGAPVPLFSTRIGGAVRGVDRQQYMVSADGQRFLMNTIIEEPTSPIIVVLNWKAR